MKKFLLVFVVLVCTTFFVSGQSTNPKTKIFVSGFDGEKPLKKDTDVSVYGMVPNGSIMMIDAYKGETRKKFLERITVSPIDSSKTVGAKRK